LLNCGSWPTHRPVRSCIILTPMTDTPLHVQLPECPPLSDIWQSSTNRKLLLTVFGIGVILATSSPQTPEAASQYLAERGYTDISLKAPKPYYGRGQKRFPFEARSTEGERVSGELSLGSFEWFYTVRLNSAPPQ
jgi:hypothetical protein